MKTLKNRVENVRLIEWLVFSSVLLFFVTKSSPLYLTNDWVDPNAYFTVGKGMVKGLVPYKDLFDQKGPLLYLIYGLASIINPTGFIGVYLFQCTAMTVNLIYCFKIFKLYFSEKLSILLTIMFPVFLLNEQYYRQGGSAEEFCIPFLMILFFQVLKEFKKEDTSLAFSKIVFFVQGMSVAAIFLIKFSLLGPWIAFYLFLLIYYLIKKQWQQLLPFFLFSALGFVAVIIPWIVYFWLHHAMSDFIETYIILNGGGAYSQNTSSIFERLFYIIDASSNKLSSTFVGMYIVAPTILLLPTWKVIAKELSHRLLLMTMALSTVVFLFVGMKDYDYYLLMALPFSIFSLLFLGQLLKNYKVEIKKLFETTFNFLAVWTVCLSFILILSSNSMVMRSKLFTPNDTISSKAGQTYQSAQELFSEYMHNKTANPTLLNFGFLDSGFYLAADILPSEKYFILLNLDHENYPKNYQGQLKMIQEKLIDYVVVETEPSEDESQFDETDLGKNYQVVMSHNQTRDYVDRTYWLLEKRTE